MELNKEEKEQVEFITDICKEFKPKKVLEIGSGWGISGSTMLSCLPEMHLTTIDPRDDLKEFEARTKIYKDRITKINGRSGENPLNPKYHSKYEARSPMTSESSVNNHADHHPAVYHIIDPPSRSPHS